MKYLMKINENIIQDKINYIEECFINFIDEGEKFTLSSYDIMNWNTKKEYLRMVIKITLQDDESIDGLLKYTEYINDITEEINSSINKVKIKYPDIINYVKLVNDSDFNGSTRKYKQYIQILIKTT